MERLRYVIFSVSDVYQNDLLENSGGRKFQSHSSLIIISYAHSCILLKPLGYHFQNLISMAVLWCKLILIVELSQSHPSFTSFLSLSHVPKSILEPGLQKCLVQGPFSWMKASFPCVFSHIKPLLQLKIQAGNLGVREREAAELFKWRNSNRAVPTMISLNCCGPTPCDV